MAIFSLSVSVVSRSQGSSAVASAAYIENRKLCDYRTGEICRCSPEGSAKDSTTERVGSWLPDGQKIDTETLWNRAEQAEKKSNARTARKIIIALPVEFNEQEQRETLNSFSRYLSDRYRVGITIAIHREHPHNPHAHMMITTREIDKNGNFGKKTRVLDDQKTGPQEVTSIRQQWATICNQILTQKNAKTIDHRSLKKQGITHRLPDLHIGSAGIRMQLKGQKSDRVEKFLKRRQISKKIYDRYIINKYTYKPNLKAILSRQYDKQIKFIEQHQQEKENVRPNLKQSATIC